MTMSKFQKGSVAAGFGALMISGACVATNHDIAALIFAFVSLSVFFTSRFAAAATGEGDGK